MDIGKLLADFADRVEENQSVFAARCDGHGQRVEIQIPIRNSQAAGFFQHAADDGNAFVFCFGNALFIHRQRNGRAFMGGHDRQYAFQAVRLDADRIDHRGLD